ncbi:MAG: hypothetical protein HYS13_15250 [Planctomycetia bacterium]|nr:hypothetical protein [Planctomycetia bacterium]
MDLLLKSAFPAALILLAAGLIVWHVREYKTALAQKPTREERDFLRRRFRRRMRAGTVIVLLALALFFGQLISPKQSPSLFVWYWSGLALAVLGLLLFALVDYLDSRNSIRSAERAMVVEAARLAAAKHKQKRGQAAGEEKSTSQIHHQGVGGKGGAMPDDGDVPGEPGDGATTV